MCWNHNWIYSDRTVEKFAKGKNFSKGRTIRFMKRTCSKCEVVEEREKKSAGYWDYVDLWVRTK